MDNITTGFIREPRTLEMEWPAVVQGLLDALHNSDSATRLMPSALKGRFEKCGSIRTGPHAQPVLLPVLRFIATELTGAAAVQMRKGFHTRGHFKDLHALIVRLHNGNAAMLRWGFAILIRQVNNEGFLLV